MSAEPQQERAPDDPPAFPPFEVRGSERLYRSEWCGLRRDEVVLPNGDLQEYHVFEIADAVCVLPLLADGSIVMIGQYRYPHGHTQWELPAGRIGDDETPEGAARRELLEESGYAPGRLESLPGFYPTGGISAHYAHAFRAQDCERVAEPALEASEQIVVRVFSREEVRALLATGRIRDAFAAITLMYHLLLEDEG